MKDSAKIISFPQKEKVREAAAHWIVQLDGGPLSKEKEKQFTKWLNASRLHKEEFFNLCYVWGKYDFFADLANVIELDRPEASFLGNAKPKQLAYAFVTGVLISFAGFLVMMNPSIGGKSINSDTAIVRSSDEVRKDNDIIVANDKLQTLEVVINELNQDLNNKIVISDETIKDLRLNREYSASNLQTLFQHLQNQYLISIYFSSDDHVYLSNEELSQL